MANSKKKPAKKKPAPKKTPTKKRPAKKSSRAGMATELAWPIRLRGNLLLEFKAALAELERAQSDRKRIGLELTIESAKPVHLPLLKLQSEAQEATRQIRAAADIFGEVQKKFGAKHGLSPKQLENLSFDPDSGAVFLGDQ